MKKNAKKIVIIVTIIIVYLLGYLSLRSTKKSNNRKNKPNKSDIPNNEQESYLVDDSVVDITPERYGKYEEILLDYIRMDTVHYNKFIKYFEDYIMNRNDDYSNLHRLYDDTQFHIDLWNNLYKTNSGSELTSFWVLESNRSANESYPKILEMFNKIHQKLYGFAYGKKFADFQQLVSYANNGKGIVFVSDSNHFKFARSTIDTLRNILETRLPIQVFYTNSNSLTEREKYLLRSYPEVYVNNLNDFFDDEIIDHVKSMSQLKPFALLASRFTENILMNVDTVFLRQPDILFKEKGYTETGALFFHDRVTFKNYDEDSSNWLNGWLRDPLPETQAMLLWMDDAYYETESSVMVINKKRTLAGLLAACQFNDSTLREKVIGTRLSGDKMTYWIGFDITHTHYYVIPSPIVIMGEPVYGKGDYGEKSLEKICGHTGHTNEKGELIYMDDHYLKDKKGNKYEVIPLEVYAEQVEDENGQNWIDLDQCYDMTERESKDVQTLEKDQLKLIELLKEKEIPILKRPYH